MHLPHPRHPDPQLSWARCGDLRRLVLLLLGRRPQAQQQRDGSSVVTAMPPLVPEPAARFYTACVLLALEHLHGRLCTVHRVS